MNKQLKTPKQIERHIKGIANHRRIEILFIIADNSEIILDEIADRLKCNLKTMSEHTRRLVQAGLVNKKYRGQSVRHTLTPYGKIFYKFIKTFSYSQEY
ncbi:MAG: winged helix-turn-helix domain-containing protein [bacterium]|nr:winged helix-turn-helix domain-containing protein [bacterium]